MKVEAKPIDKNTNLYSYVNLSSIYIDGICFDIFENSTTDDDVDIIKKFLNDIIDYFENKTEYFYYAKFEEIFTWPRFYKLMDIIYSVFSERKLQDRIMFLDNNTSFKFKENNYNYFGIPLMLGHVVINRENGQEEILSSENINEYLKDKKFERTFLSFNGRPKEHREELVQFIVDNKLEDKFYYSFGTSYGNNQNHKLYKRLNDDFDDNKRGIGLRLSGYEKKAFCYVITENSVGFQNTTDDEYLDTLVEYKPNLFSHITEKITRGIGTMMPFILVGQPYTLKILKENGFKTFDKWWDESYDLEENYHLKMDSIKKIILDISTWNIEKQKRIYSEMMPILYHNLKRHDELRTSMYDRYNLPTMVDYNSKNESLYKSYFQKKYSNLTFS